MSKEASSYPEFEEGPNRRTPEVDEPKPTQADELPPVEAVSLVKQLDGLENAFYGLSKAADFDDTLAGYQVYVKDRIAGLILSDELKAEIDGLEVPRDRALVTQAINEMSDRIFERPDYCHDWEQNRQWLGDAIIYASQLSA